MSIEQDIIDQLVKNFAFLAEKARVQRVRRLVVSCPIEKITPVFEYLVKTMGFTMLSSLTGLDEGATMGVIYHLARPSGELLNLSTSVPKERPIVQTVTAIFPAAEMYERELVDLLGMDVQGLLPGKRYPLPDDWPDGQYPLRKDWKMDSLPSSLSMTEDQDNA